MVLCNTAEVSNNITKPVRISIGIIIEGWARKKTKCFFTYIHFLSLDIWVNNNYFYAFFIIWNVLLFNNKVVFSNYMYENLYYVLNWLINWMSDLLIGWLIIWLACLLICLLTDRPTDRLAVWLADWLVEWLTDWLAVWPADWLTDWLAEY